ncbi:UvrD-helicase domain-containing protein [Nocardia sp. NPDC057353]|uniref:UvrD-helicase domain-containing protein n=1 Tax=Nocardia sp. NPDC057353 TaxID=3346104 RepID=UPI003634AC74
MHAAFTGPARLSGPAGTGKTVVALHRMARFAKTRPGRLLFTSFVRTLPGYHRAGFDRLAPRVGERAEFMGLHAWASRFLAWRGVAYRLPRADEKPYEDAFARAWTRARNDLAAIEGTDYEYWREEVGRVIEGRGITTLAEYLAIDRPGRNRIRLGATQRTTVWHRFYLPYRERLAERGIDTFHDVIAKALAEITARPLDHTEDYGLVVVDEVQDFTLTQLRLAHHIAGGGPNAPLLLVGDGQQQVYAGGWRLSDAGIPLGGGRGRVLRTNYRNRDAVLRYAQRIEAMDTVDDLDGGPGFAVRDSDGVLPGGDAVELRVPRTEVDAALLRAVAAVPPGSDIAVLVDGRTAVRHYLRLLTRAGHDALALEEYDGMEVAAIKVGTVHRAKGMDFAAVFRLVDEEPDQGDRDRAELLARQHLVAASRARDYLWVATVTGLSAPKSPPRARSSPPPGRPGRAGPAGAG